MPIFSSFNARAVGLSLTAEDAVEFAAAHGFEGVDLPVRDFLDHGGDAWALRGRMDDLGLRGGAWPLPVDWRGDRSRFALDLTRLPRLAEAAAILGLRRTGTWVMPAVTDPLSEATDPEVTLREAIAFHVERLGAIARILRAVGVDLGLEVIGVESFRDGGGRPFVCRLADLDETLGVLRHESPNVGVVLDGYHLYAAGEAFEAGLVWGIERVVWVQVADLPASAPADRRVMRDGDRGLPGEHGAIDSRALLKRLVERGYDGPITVETLAGCRALAGLSPELTVRRVAASLRSVWPDAMPWKPPVPAQGSGNRGSALNG